MNPKLDRKHKERYQPNPVDLVLWRLFPLPGRFSQCQSELLIPTEKRSACISRPPEQVAVAHLRGQALQSLYVTEIGLRLWLSSLSVVSWLSVPASCVVFGPGFYPPDKLVCDL